MSSAMPNTFGKSLNISSIFHWNISPAGAAPNSSLLYLYLPNWHVNVVRYDDLSSNLRLWWPDLASIRERYFTLFSFRKISLSVGPLWTGLMSAWFSFARSKYSLTLQLDSGMRTKFLYHSAISSTPRAVLMSCCWSLSNFSLKGFCSAYATHLRGTWYG